LLGQAERRLGVADKLAAVIAAIEFDMTIH
jgi:hypothetical protein